MFIIILFCLARIIYLFFLCVHIFILFPLIGLITLPMLLLFTISFLNNTLKTPTHALFLKRVFETK